jgi:hypothetical protein
MEKTPLHLGLRVGPMPFVSEEADREQWKLAPKILGPSIVERILARSNKATPADTASANRPQGSDGSGEAGPAPDGADPIASP